MRRGPWLSSALGALCLSATGAIAAEEQASPPAAGAANSQRPAAEAVADTAGQNPDIVVTAQYREERLQEVPLALQAFSGEQLEETGVQSLAELIDFIPGASEGRGNAAGIQSYQIRGVSSFLGDSTIGYYLDEAAYVIPNRNYAPVARTFDVDRVEVLRGPQGTLYGLGSMGGTIRFITADPDLTDFRARGQAGYSFTAEDGEDNYYGDLALSAPIVRDRLAVRGAVSYEKRGGFAFSPSFPGDIDSDEFENYRFKLLAKPVDALTVKLGYQRNVAFDKWGRNYDNANLERFVASPVRGRARQVYDMYTGFVSLDLGSLALESSTGYVDRRDRFTGPIVLGPRAFELRTVNVSDSFVQEVRAVSKGDTPFQYVVGGIYLDAKSTEDIVVVNGPPISVVSTYDSKSYAVFGEFSYGFFDGKLRPLVGLRYFEDNRDFTTQSRLPRVTPAFTREAKFDSLSPRFNLAYKPSDQALFFINVAKGFRSGTFNTAAAVNTGGPGVEFEVEPDKIWSYELGTKLTLADSKLFLELVVYKFDWSNVQLNYTVAGGVQVIRNAGEIDGTGFEYGLTWRPAPGLAIQASGNINKTKFDSLINPALFAATPSIAVGRQVASVPRNDHTIGVSYQAPFFNDVDLVLNGAYSYVSKQGDVGVDIPTITRFGRLGQAHHLLRARAGLQFGKMQVALFGENLLNDNDPIQVSGSGSTRYYPRVVGLELRFDH
jgi:iron complex outermembrane recepter protein